jgi:hypothetical protein
MGRTDSIITVEVGDPMAPSMTNGIGWLAMLILLAFALLVVIEEIDSNVDLPFPGLLEGLKFPALVEARFAAPLVSLSSEFRSRKGPLPVSHLRSVKMVR